MVATSGTGTVSSAVVMVGSRVRVRRTIVPAAAGPSTDHCAGSTSPAGGPGPATPAGAARPDLRFPIASLSKQMTAVCALLLVDEKVLDLHGPIGRWLPDAAPQWREVSVHHLLTHTAGFGHWGDRPGYEIFVRRTVAERVDLFLHSDRLSAPGRRWHYSSPGYIVLGHLIERASGRPYAAYLTDRVLRPLALAHTTAGPAPAQAPLAAGHAGGRPVEPWDPGVLAGTTDVWSTAEDVTRFISALHGGALLGPDRLARMTTPHAAATLHARHDRSWLSLPGYGYGLYCGTLGGQPVVLHTGELPGFRAIGLWLPRQAAAVAVLANDEHADLPAALADLLPDLAPRRARAQADTP